MTRISGRLKIAVVGSYNSGKTTLVRLLDATCTSVDAPDACGSTTVALDFGRVCLDGMEIYLFGTPGQERFSATRTVASYGADGIIVVVDSCTGMTEQDAAMCEEIEEAGIPMIIALNKIDLNPSARKVRYRPELVDLVHPVSATTGEGVLQALRALMVKIRDAAGAESMD